MGPLLQIDCISKLISGRQKLQSRLLGVAACLGLLTLGGCHLLPFGNSKSEFKLAPSSVRQFWLERAWPTGDIPPGARERAVALLQSWPDGIVADAPRLLTVDTSSAWQPVGPPPIVDYYGEVLSGHIEAIALDPRNAQVIYAGASGGGVWKSIDQGTNWRPLTDNQPALDISAFAIAPSDPDTVYAASGFYYQTPGFLKSTDGGDTWRSLPIPATFPASRRTAPISSLAISPLNSSVLLAAFGY